jgi:copper(I)-binding protein
MSPVSAVTVAPGGRLAFKPGGHHLMLVDLKQPLKQGERFKGILVFEKAGRIPVEFEVRAIGAGAEHGSHHAR